METDYDATLHHIGLLHRKATALCTAQIEAEEQLAHRLAMDYANGKLDIEQLVEVYEKYKSTGHTGFYKRWREAGLPGNIQQVARTMQQAKPNGPDGVSWQGPWPLWDSPRPPRGQAVAYVLFDASNTPCYVGSTKSFESRLGQHKKDGKKFSAWSAYPCVDREEAYVLEEKMLAEYMPYLNKRRTR